MLIGSAATGDKPETAKKRSRPPAPGQMVLYAGLVAPNKGVLLLLAAATHVVRAIADTQFVIAGAVHPTLSREYLEERVLELGLNHSIQLVGHVSRHELAGYYRRATVCVVPSYYETFGLAALESMAFGVPVVAANAGGLPEVVEDNVTGILVPPGDANALAEAILALLRDTEVRRRMGEAGRKRALSQFSAQVVIKQTTELYDALVSGKEPSSFPTE